MHGSRGQQRASMQAYGNQNLLLAVACPDNDRASSSSSSAFSNGSSSFFPQSHHYHHQNQKKVYHSNPPPTKPLREAWSSTTCTSSSRNNMNERVRPRSFDEESLFSLNYPPVSHPTTTNRHKGGGGSRTNPSSSPPGRRKLIYRCFQVFSLLILGISVYALVENIKYLIRTYDGDLDELLPTQEIDNRFVNINEELQSWVIEKESEFSIQPPIESTPQRSSRSKTTTTLSSTPSRITENLSSSPSFKHLVLNINSISFDINNDSVCRSPSSTVRKNLKGTTTLTTTGSDSGIYFMIIIHSAPAHFEARQAIRSTWGSVKSLKNVAFRLVFLTGRMNSGEEDADLVQSSVLRESEIFGDIISGSFVDSYKNLTIKHLLGYKWASTYCPNSAFILKADDDAFVDIFQLFDFISRTYGLKPAPGTLICNVFPEGSKPVRATDSVGTKWAVSIEEYPHSIYPKYCGGLAYLVTPDVIKRILDLSDKVRSLWIDDVFVSGILRELAGVEPFYLNLRYSYDPERYRKWLNSKDIQNNNNINNNINNGSAGIIGISTNKNNNLISANMQPSKLPFMVTHVERGSKFSQEMNQLWRKTLKVWSKEFITAKYN